MVGIFINKINSFINVIKKFMKIIQINGILHFRYFYKIFNIRCLNQHMKLEKILVSILNK